MPARGTGKYAIQADGSIVVNDHVVSFNPDNACWYVHPQGTDGEGDNAVAAGVFSGKRARGNAINFARRHKASSRQALSRPDPSPPETGDQQ